MGMKPQSTLLWVQCNKREVQLLNSCSSRSGDFGYQNFNACVPVRDLGWVTCDVSLWQS